MTMFTIKFADLHLFRQRTSYKSKQKPAFKLRSRIIEHFKLCRNKDKHPSDLLALFTCGPHFRQTPLERTLIRKERRFFSFGRPPWALFCKIPNLRIVLVIKLCSDICSFLGMILRIRIFCSFDGFRCTQFGPLFNKNRSGN